ncbi:MAG: arginase, partial [Spirochaetales bacterium]|nr:arginase [Spirochaetales bacterium]
VIWIDAHADFNTPETSPSGNIHGMSLAASCGWGHPLLTKLYGPSPKLLPQQVVLVGVRDLDPGEKLNLKHSGIKVFTMADIDRWGMAEIAQRVRQVMEPQTDWHVSLDIDVLDPDTAPGVGTPVPGGLTYRELHLLLESLAETQRVTSADVVEVNPILDTKNQTARVAVAMVSSLLGATIL